MVQRRTRCAHQLHRHGLPRPAARRLHLATGLGHQAIPRPTRPMGRNRDDPSGRSGRGAPARRPPRRGIHAVGWRGRRRPSAVPRRPGLTWRVRWNSSSRPRTPLSVVRPTARRAGSRNGWVTSRVRWATLKSARTQPCKRRRRNHRTLPQRRRLVPRPARTPRADPSLLPSGPALAPGGLRRVRLGGHTRQHRLRTSPDGPVRRGRRRVPRSRGPLPRDRRSVRQRGHPQPTRRHLYEHGASMGRAHRLE